MTNILFVDDESNVLSALRRMLHPMRGEWTVEYVTSAREAIVQLEQQQFDVVVTDMRMPGTDGAELLSIVRERWPHAARLVLSGQSEMTAIMRSVPVAHQFLNKPCDPVALKDAVLRAVSLAGDLEDLETRALVGRVAALPSPSALVDEMEALLADETCQIADVVAIVERDPASAARLLQLVNSSFFGLARSVTRPSDAVNSLGLSTLRKLAGKPVS